MGAAWKYSSFCVKPFWFFLRKLKFIKASPNMKIYSKVIFYGDRRIFSKSSSKPYAWKHFVLMSLNKHFHERFLVNTTDFECAFPPLRCYHSPHKNFSSRSNLNFFLFTSVLLKTPWDAATTWRFSRKTLAATAAAQPSNQNKSSRGMDGLSAWNDSKKHEQTVSFLCSVLSSYVIGSCSTFRRREMKIIALRKWKTTETDKSFMAKHISSPRSIIRGRTRKVAVEDVYVIEN